VAISVRPASFDDVQVVFGSRGEAFRCQCQWFKIPGGRFKALSVAERTDRLRADPGGLVAYLDDEPVGWCAVEPRVVYHRLQNARVPWAGRAEDRDDPDVWAVTCFVTRVGFRRRGVSRALAAAAVDHARDRGATAVEGYPLVALPGQEFSWGELYVGSRSVFADAGFTQVSQPTPRRVVMRYEFGS
jgi:GNAT superfamily N-acetyltransferase